jgi:hypothetical protein
MPPSSSEETEHAREGQCEQQQHANSRYGVRAGLRYDAEVPQNVDRDDHEHEDNEREDEGHKDVDARFGVVDCVACGPFGACFLLGGALVGHSSGHGGLREGNGGWELGRAYWRAKEVLEVWINMGACAGKRKAFDLSVP